MATFTLSDVNQTLELQNDKITRSNALLSNMSSNLKTFIERSKSQALKAREEAIEGGAKPVQTQGTDIPQAGLFGGIGAALAGLIPAISTIIGAGIGATIASFDEQWNDFSRTVVSGWLGILTKMKSLFTGFFKMFGPSGLIGGAVIKFIDVFRDTSKVFDETALRWRNIDTGRFAKAPGQISIVLDRISNTFKSVFGEESKLAKMFAKIKGAFTIADDSPLMKIVNKVSPMFKTLGGILKKIFLPIGLIFTAYDTIKGAIEGYEENGFVGALTGAVTGLLASVVGAPLNLIKEIGLWVAKQFGLSDEDADKISAAMDFEKIIKDFGKAIANLINKAVDWVTNFDIGEAVGKAWDALTGTNPDLTPNQQAQLELSRIPGMQKIIREQGIDKARELVKEEYGGRKEEKILSLLDKLEEAPQLNEGTRGLTGKLFANFGKGTLSILHGNEAVVPEDSPEGELLKTANTYNFNKKPKDEISTQATPEGMVMPKGMGSFLGKMLDASAPMSQFAHQKGTELKAKEEAMRAAGASDMDIAQSMMGDMGGMLGSLKNLAPKIDLSQAPKMKSNPIKEALAPNNLGNTFGSIVREAEENKEKRATQSSPAPMIISDNSSKSSSTSNTAMPIISKPYDFDDPFVSGIGRTRGL